MRLFVWVEEELPCGFSGLRDKDFPLRILQHEDDVKQFRRSRRGQRDDSGPGSGEEVGGGVEGLRENLKQRLALG